MKITTDAVRRTARTLLAGVATLAVVLPLLVAELQQAGVDVVALWPWVPGLLAVLAAITRVMQSGTVDAVLEKVDLGREPKHRAPDLTGE